MGFAKDRMIEQMQEEREDLTNALDDIESYGESFRWCVIELRLVPLQFAN